MDEDDLTTV